MSWRGRGPLPLPAAAKLLGRLPAFPGSWLFARVLNSALAPQLLADTRARLEGKHLRLRVSDMGLNFDVCWRGARFVPLAPGTHTDLVIGAAMPDLWLLARREEDPDSLFFSRRLTLEGDTELGLLFKNALDAFDLGAFDLLLRRLGQFPLFFRRPGAGAP